MALTLDLSISTQTAYSSGSSGLVPLRATASPYAGSPVGALPGMVGNLVMDSTTGHLWACTSSGSSGSTVWEPVIVDSQLTDGSLSPTFKALAVTGAATVGGNLSYLPYVIAPTASQTLPNNQKVICQTGALTADITLTTGSPPVGGEAIIYGSAAAYTTTVSTGVTSGSPYIEMPDGSQVYSYVIPASSPTAGIRLVWDGTNYRAKTFGPTIVANASAANQAVALEQLFIGNRKAVFTANGTWTVPSYVSTIWVSGCAGGGGGGGGAFSVSGGNGGGAGQSTIKQAISVTGGHSLSITIGGGGANGGTGNTAGTAGGNTVLGDSTASTTLLTLAGGGGGSAGGSGSSTTNAANSAGASGYPAGGNGAIINGYSYGGSGGSSPFGGGGAASQSIGQGTAQNASGYGSGGGGGGGAVDGGNGAPGFFVIEW